MEIDVEAGRPETDGAQVRPFNNDDGSLQAYTYVPIQAPAVRPTGEMRRAINLRPQTSPDPD